MTLCKLAWGNVRRAGRDYLVYLFTLTLGVAVFYAFNTVSMQADVAGISEEGLADLLGETLGGLTYFLAGVMGFLMVYANNFITKRRKKEFGLYQVLGMPRGRVALIMAVECAIVSGGALLLGLLLGLGVSWVMTFFTASLFKTQISSFHFFFSVPAFSLTVGCLAVVFALTLLLNLRVVARTQLIELMGAGRANESIKTRNPWVAGLLFVAGMALVGWAYARLLHDSLPIQATGDELDEALKQFGLTTLMVTAGTFLLFFGLSGALLKMLQTARGLYWRGLNMFTVRQLAAKVNTVSFSMGVISMILFLAITSVTCGMSIASVMNENLETYNPVDFSQQYVYVSRATRSWFDSVFPSDTQIEPAQQPYDLYEKLHGQSVENGELTGEVVSVKDVAGEHVQIDTYLPIPLGTSDAPLVTPGSLATQMGIETPDAFSATTAETCGLSVAPVSQYNALLRMRGLPEVDLGDDGYVITSDLGESITGLYDQFMAGGNKLALGGFTLSPRASAVDVHASALCDSAMGGNPGTIIVPDAVLEQLNLTPYASSLLVDYKDSITTEQGDDHMTYLFADEASDDGVTRGYWGSKIERTEMYAQAASMNGLISYLAVYIGFVLVVACAAILAIQQLSGVADSTRSYRVLAELGCEGREARHSVLAQQGVFFGLPLVVGVAHSCVALSVIIDLVKLFGRLSIGGTVGLTCAVFLAAYGGYFFVTYAISAGIVREAMRTRKSE